MECLACSAAGKVHQHGHSYRTRNVLCGRFAEILLRIGRHNNLRPYSHVALNGKDEILLVPSPSAHQLPYPAIFPDSWSPKRRVVASVLLLRDVLVALDYLHSHFLSHGNLSLHHVYVPQGDSEDGTDMPDVQQGRRRHAQVGGYLNRVLSFTGDGIPLTGRPAMSERVQPPEFYAHPKRFTHTFQPKGDSWAVGILLLDHAGVPLPWGVVGALTMNSLEEDQGLNASCHVDHQDTTSGTCMATRRERLLRLCCSQMQSSESDSLPRSLLASDGPLFARVSSSLGEDLATLCQQCLHVAPSQRPSAGDALMEVKRVLAKIRVEMDTGIGKVVSQDIGKFESGNRLRKHRTKNGGHEKRARGAAPRVSYWHMYPRVRCLESEQENQKAVVSDMWHKANFSVLRGNVFRERGGNFVFSSPRDGAAFLLPNFVPCLASGQHNANSAELSVSIAEKYWERRLPGQCERCNVDCLGLVCHIDLEEEKERGEGKEDEEKAEEEEEEEERQLQNDSNGLWKGGAEEGELIYESIARQLRCRGLNRDLTVQLDKDLVRCHPYHFMVSSPAFRSHIRRVLEVWLHFGQRDGRAYWQGVDSIAAPFLLDAMVGLSYCVRLKRMPLLC